LGLFAYLAAASAGAADLPRLSPDAAEPQVLELLGKVGDGGDAYAAHLATKAWLSRHPSPSPAVLLAAADTARVAGDLQAAAAIYKRFIAAAPADEARSKVAARLYAILIGQLQSNDDAYSFFARSGLDLRQSPEARRFDGWFLEQARARKDAVTAARILAAVMAEKLPLELERNLFWDHLDWAMGELARATPDRHAAAPAARQVVGLVRESPHRAARYGVITAWLEFQAAAAGKDAAAQAAAFAPVAAAATAYVDAVPTAATLADVQNILYCGTQSPAAWQTLGGPIRGWWTASFVKLPDDEKAKAISWNNWWQQQATNEQWLELATKFPAVFQASQGARSLPLLTNKPDPAVFAAMAPFLQGVPSETARLVNSINATRGTDLRAGLEHLGKNETWYGDFGVVWPASGQLVQTWRNFPRQPAASQADISAAVTAWGREAVARTPLALFHPDAAAGWLTNAFSAADPADKSAFVADLRRLDWVPWDTNARRAAVKPAHDTFKQWADQVRKTVGPAQAAAKAAAGDKAKAAEAARWEKAAGQIAPLEEEFKKAFDANVPATVDRAKLADPLALHLGRCVQAIRENKLDAYVASGREAYKLVRLHSAEKTPYGQAALRWLLSHKAGDVDLAAFQAEVIADQIAAWEPGKPTAALMAIDAAMVGGRPNVPNYWSVPAKLRDHVLRLNPVIGKGILDQLTKGRFEPELFSRFRHTKLGQGWVDQEAGKEVLAKLIETKAFLVHKQGMPSAAAYYQRLVRDEFQSLAKQYPPESFFDDLFVEEAKASGWLDWAFTNYSRDEKQKAAGAAAELFASRAGLAAGPNAPMDYDRLPQTLVAGDRRDVATRPATWGPVDVRNWYGRAASAPAAQRAKFIEAAEAGWGKTRFDTVAMGYASLPTDPAAIAQPQARGDFFKQVNAILDLRKGYPSRIGTPSLAISQIPANSLTPDETATLLAAFSEPTPPAWPGGSGYEQAGLSLVQALLAAGRDAEALRIAPELWRVARDTGNGGFSTQLAALATGVAKAGKPGVAAAIAESGLQVVGQTMPEVPRAQLAAIRTDALLSLGGGNPVPRNDPRWPIFEAQIQLAAGKPQSAWELYLPNAAVVAQAYKELDPAFTAWLIRENTATGRFDQARELGQLLLAWSDSSPGALTPEAQAGLLLAYADIALARREYAQARALYERIAAAKEFDGTDGKRDAELRVAEVDRLTRQFDKAQEALQRLTRRADRGVQAEAFYQLALLKTDREEIEEAAGCLEDLFTRVPNHVGGRILEGKLNLLRRKYDVASKVKLGVLGDKKFLIPGKPLEVDLEDRNLAVVGKASQIEIRAWTAGGDEERFNLFPFGDSKTRFTGQIPTQLGVPTKGDHVLQVAGGDTVRYTFSESFTAGKGAMEEPAAMTVVSDGGLFASSGRILSKEEQESLALERMIRQKLALDAGSAEEVALSARRSDDQIKPGNAVNVRVVDPDRSTTSAADTVEVRATTASGDTLVAKLVETAPFSGVFEGSVPTRSGQATAYASDSTEGTDPNNAIGPAGETPWVGLADSKRPKFFAVDLNDNVALGKLTVTANVPGRKLKDVYVQTSLNGRDFRTVGQWRADGKASFVPWDGGPRMELVRAPAPGAQSPPPATPAAFAAYLDEGRHAAGSPLVVAKIDALAVGPLDGNLGGHAGLMGMNTGWYVGHWVTGFEVAKPQTRTLTLAPKGKMQNISYVFAVDGQMSQDRTKPLEIKRLLSKGAHRIDVYAFANQNAGLNFEVLIDAPEPPFTASIPKEEFSVEKHPAITDAFAVAPAKITANADGSVLDVAFAAGARARVVRLLIADYETDAPAVNAVALLDAGGKKVLPTEQSFLDLTKNDRLEIIPGDKITVLYEDPAVITPERKSQEKFLTATFTNAEVSAAFVEFKEQGGERQTRYIPMRRFAPGDTVKVFIGDPDMDVSAEPDRVPFTVRAGRDKPIQVEALETEPHSGVFIGTVFPVAGEPARPAEIKVAPDDDLLVAYLDRENTDPGISWERTSLVEQSGAGVPQLRVYDVASRPLDGKERAAVAAKQQVGRRFEEKVPVTRELVAVRPEQPAAPDRPASIVVDGPLLVELLAPAIAKSAESEAVIYVQTAAGREKLGREIAANEFPLDAPGTIRLVRRPGDAGGIIAPPGASGVVVRGNRFAAEPLAEGRFMFLVAKELGPVPAASLAEVDPVAGDPEPPVLQIRGNDTIFVGHKFATGSGAERWAVQSVNLTGDVLFDVMDERYREEIEGTFVGDALHVRLISPVLDISDDKDVATVKLVASGGGELDLALTETFGHSGIFKGSAKLAYRDAAAAADGRTLPVAYGESVKITYAPPTGDPIERKVAIFKGGDASVVPFTKRFNDPTIAVQTQFTVAEAWFELAKRHRELGQESLARREIAQGKKLLEEAIRDYPDTDARAQADYLLANLSYEFSKEAADEQTARQHALDAVARFSDIVASHPESEYAPKSQYKKALVLETLGEIDQACEEYVKLSYRYPDNELVAETIARLGQYFLGKGKKLDEEAAAQTDPVEREKVAIKGREMFTTAAEVFGRLSERFPQHALANKTKMLSAQCYLRAKDYERSLAVFEGIAKDPQSDKDLAAEAMYWAGDICLQTKKPKDAYRAFKKVTWDFPESKWAKFARGRLTEDAMVKAADAEEKE
jgi:TolA-binding protein